MSTFWASPFDAPEPKRRREAIDLGPGFSPWSFDDLNDFLPELISGDVGAISSPQDRWQGQNWPLVRTEEDLGRIRFGSRLLCAVSPLAQGASGGMCAYTIGEGYQHKAGLVESLRKHVLKTQGQGDDEKWAKIAAMAQTEWDDFKRRTLYEEWQQELFSRLVEEGEFFLQCGESQQRFDIRTIEPEQVRKLPSWQENGSFGILTEPGDVLTRVAYGVYWQSGRDWEAYDAEDVIHYKRNVVRSVKRGIPDFAWNAGLLIRTAGKLLYNMGVGSSIQAAIAFIRSHEFGSRGEVESLAHENADYYRQNVRTGQIEYRTRYEPGTVLDCGKGSTYAPPPFGTNASAHVDVCTAVCQGVAASKNLPLWMVNGDSTNANYASAVVAESPFVHRVLQWQGVMKRLDAELFRRCMETGVRYRRVPAEVLQYVELQSTPPSITTRKQLDEASCNQIYLAAKIKSPQTIRQELSLDNDQEDANFRQWEQEHPQQPGMGGDGQAGAVADPAKSQAMKMAAMQRGQGAVGEGPEHTAESIKEDVTWDENKHPRADDGKFGKGAGKTQAHTQDKPHTDKEEARARKRVQSTQAMPHNKAVSLLDDLAELHGSQGKHGLAKIYSDEATARRKVLFDKMMARKRARYDENDPAHSRPTKPDERTPEKALSPGEYKEPPWPKGKGHKAGGYSATGLTNTEVGDMAEALLTKLNLRPIMPPGHRQNPLDAEADHSGQAFEIKACTTASTEYKCKPKASEMKEKREYAEKHGLKPATMIAVVDYDKKEIHAYWKDGLGYFNLSPTNLDQWNYAGTVAFSDEDVKLWSNPKKPAKAKKEGNK